MISEKSKSILLLTAYLPGSGKGAAKPLSTGEYNRLATWMRDQKMSPEQLLVPGLQDRLKSFLDQKVLPERIEKLLGRGAALAMALDKWESAGIWVVNRGDVDYPSLVKKRLQKNCPPIFFGCGNPKLLKTPGIGVVGSRKAGDSDLEVTRSFGKLVADQGYSVVSGAARGVDETSMLGALEAGGTAIGIVADGLLKKASSKKYRDYLMQKELVLLSPFGPEARFNVGNAMARNKLIYTQSQATIVIHSGMTGGTIAGAEENLKKGWVPLWVKRSKDSESANQALIKAGGKELPESVERWLPLILAGAHDLQEERSLFSEAVDQEAPDLSESQWEDPEESNALYQHFISLVSGLVLAENGGGIMAEELSERLSLRMDQTREWLELAAARKDLAVMGPEMKVLLP